MANTKAMVCGVLAAMDLDEIVASRAHVHSVDGRVEILLDLWAEALQFACISLALPDFLPQ